MVFVFQRNISLLRFLLLTFLLTILVSFLALCFFSQDEVLIDPTMAKSNIIVYIGILFSDDVYYSVSQGLLDVQMLETLEHPALLD